MKSHKIKQNPNRKNAGGGGGGGSLPSIYQGLKLCLHLC